MSHHFVTHHMDLAVLFFCFFSGVFCVNQGYVHEKSCIDLEIKNSAK